MLEKDIEQRLVQETKRMGGKAYKFVSPGNAGVPDRLVVLPGNKIGFCELKQPGKPLRPLQKNQIAALRQKGCFAALVDSPDKVKPFLEQLTLWPVRTGDFDCE